MSDAVYKEIEGDENADIIYRIVMGVLEKTTNLTLSCQNLWINARKAQFALF